MASDPSILSFLERSRAHFGFDPDSSPSLADFTRIAELCKDSSALPSSKAFDDSADASDAADFLARLNLSVAQGNSQTSQCGSPVAAAQSWNDFDELFAADPEARAEIEAIEAESDQAGEDKDGAREKRMQNLEKAFELRDKEMATKDGKAKWEKLENKWGCPGRWKESKERVMERRVNGKLDWRETAEAIKAFKEKRKESGAATQNIPAGNTKGKKKGKK